MPGVVEYMKDEYMKDEYKVTNVHYQAAGYGHVLHTHDDRDAFLMNDSCRRLTMHCSWGWHAEA